MQRLSSFVRGLGLLFVASASAIAACSSSPSGAATSAGGAATSAGGAHAGGGGAGQGGQGGEPLPTLDPKLCVLSPDAGEDPSVAAAAEQQRDPSYVFPKSDSIQRDKAFPLTSLLAADPALMADLAQDATLGAASTDRDARLRGAVAKCDADAACLGNEVAFSATESDALAKALSARLASSGRLAAFAQGMRASARFSVHAKEADGALVEAAFTDLVTALMATEGQIAGELGGAKLRDVVTSVVVKNPTPLAFFEPLLRVDLAALLADGRDEAERYEPLAQGENAKALARIPTLDFKAFPFTVILVPGQGPDKPGVAIDPVSMLRADLAAQRFAAKLAPLIVLSGGHVHPDRTQYSEAIEMKKYLRATYSIPEEALLVDPHARHTTTNLRNVSRLLYSYGIPTDKALCVTSDLGQSIYIAYWDGAFGPRCQTELGYLPWRALVPMSKNDACMIPVAVSLFADGRDPLDP